MNGSGCPLPIRTTEGSRLIVHAAVDAQGAMDLVFGRRFEEEKEATEYARAVPADSIHGAVAPLKRV